MCVWMKGEKLCGVKNKACKVELSSKPTPNLKNPLWGLAYLGRLHMAWPIDFLHKVQLESVLSELKDTKVKGTKFTKCVDPP